MELRHLNCNIPSCSQLATNFQAPFSLFNSFNLFNPFGCGSAALRYFMAVAEEQNVTRASRTVSMALPKLK